MKINYQKLNASFFLVGIVLAALLQFLNSRLIGVDFKMVFALSLIALVLLFYRFNNGIIALVRGSFGKPRKNGSNSTNFDENKQLDKGQFKFRALTLLASVVLPNAVISSFIEVKGMPHIVSSSYVIAGIVILLLYFLLPVVKPAHYEYFSVSNSKKKTNKQDISLYLLLSALAYIPFILNQTVLNTAWYIVLIGLISVPAICVVHKLLFLEKIKNAEKYLTYAVISFLIAFMCAGVVSGINYSIPVKSYSQTYAIRDKHIESGSKSGDKYYATVRMDGKNEDVRITSDIFYSNANTIKLVRAKGILGVEYITQA